jgi:hypothetical protein
MNKQAPLSRSLVEEKTGDVGLVLSLFKINIAIFNR